MQARALGNALAIALISVFLMLGALSISLVEFVPVLTPTASPVPLLLPVTVTLTSQPIAASSQIIDTSVPTITFTPTITATSPSSCLVPVGWGQVVVQPNDTLESIAARYRVDPNQLLAGNCLLSVSLVTGSVLYVPPGPTNTVAVCYQGAAGWIKNYVVKHGDTIYSIATSYGVTAISMKNANCHPSDWIYAGETLWVPNVPTRTPATAPSLTPMPRDTAIPSPTPTDPLTATALPYTSTPVPSPVPNTPTPVPTKTIAPTFTASPTAFPQ